MDKQTKREVEEHVIKAARQFGISNVLFRNAVGDKLGVNATDMECLGLLFFKGIASPTELSKHTGLSSGATTAMLDRLEKARLIRRRPNPDDRRGTLIVIDDRAKKTVGPLFASGRQAQNKLVGRYSEAELKVVADFLQRFADVYDTERIKLSD